MSYTARELSAAVKAGYAKLSSYTPCPKCGLYFHTGRASTAHVRACKGKR
jgi:hypothetical protein